MMAVWGVNSTPTHLVLVFGCDCVVIFRMVRMLEHVRCGVSLVDSINHGVPACAVPAASLSTVLLVLVLFAVRSPVAAASRGAMTPPTPLTPVSTRPGSSLADDLRRSRSQATPLFSPSLRREGGAEVMTIRSPTSRPGSGMKDLVGM